MLSRRFTLTAFSACIACAVPVAADLNLTLAAPGDQPAKPARTAKARPKPKPASAASVAPRVAVPRPPVPAAASNIAQVVRRGTLPSRGRVGGYGGRSEPPPVLPPVDGTAVLPTPLPQPVPPVESSVTVNARLGRVIAPSADTFRLPDPRSQWIGRLVRDQQIAIVSQWQGYYAIVMADGSQAYIPQTQVEVLQFQVRTVVKSTQPVVPAPASPAATPPAAVETSALYGNPGSSMVKGVIDEAFRYKGTPYVWGGNSEAGIDCSGLVRNCFKAQGVSLPRRASEQAQVGQEVPLDQLQPGDRIYFSVKKEFDHTGIYLGNGYFIHSGRSRGGVGVDHLSQNLYRRSLSAARRL